MCICFSAANMKMTGSGKKHGCYQTERMLHEATGKGN